MPDRKQPVDQTKAEALRKWTDMMQNSGADLGRKMHLVALDINAILNPEEVLMACAKNATGEIQQTLLNQLKELEIAEITKIFCEAVKETGADPKQILDTATRTPEQQQALHKASLHRQLARAYAFDDSDYMYALEALEGIEGLFDEYDEQRPAEEMSVKKAFLLYYFATRPDIRPSMAGNLTEADKESLIDQYKRFDAFLATYLEDETRTDNGDFMTALQAFISSENPDEAPEIIEHLVSILPTHIVIPNNKLANIIATKNIVDMGGIFLRVSTDSVKKPIETFCILTYEGDNVKLTGRYAFTEYDRNVYNAVCSLYVFGNEEHNMTPAMICRAMAGQTNTEKPTEGQIESVIRSLDKMRFIRARIDCTAELQARGIKLNSQQINNGEIDTYLLAAEAVKLETGGEIVAGYHIIKPPILYEYAAAVNQVLTLPASILNVKELDKNGAITTRSLSNTESRILIKGYLIRRIEGMKGKNKLKNPVIALYDYERDGDTHQGLYSIAGNPDPTRTEAYRIRDDAEKMLAYWQATGYIAGYEIQTQKKKITGYKITV